MLRTICVLAIALFTSASSLFAASDPTYAALRASRPDGRTIALNDFTFERDVLTFKLTGKLHLLTPVEGKTPGAVFIGRGKYELKPASQIEQRQLVLNTGDDKLTSLIDEFDSAVFLGGALLAAAEKHATPATETASDAANDRWNDYLKKQRKDFHTNVHVRLLQEIVDGGEPFFFSWLNGKKYPPAILIVDPRGAEEVRLGGRDMAGEQTMLYMLDNTKGGIWYSSRYRSEIEKGSGVRVPPLADADHYAIDATIRGAELSATTTMTFTPNSNLRVLPIELTGRLRLSDASLAKASEPNSWTPIATIQEDKDEDPDAALVFSTPLTKGEKYLLKTAYAGKDVLDNAGDGNFTVTRRTSWYPNVGVFSDLATYELRFRTPQKFQIVGVGTEIENRVDGEDRIAVWKTDHPIRVAGFNYGKFKKMAEVDKDSGIAFEVYTNPGTPDIIREINAILEGGHEMGEFDSMAGPHIKVDTAKLAQSAMADGMNTARTGNHFFGPLQHKRIALTQQSQWFFGQSWPTLIYMPYIAFLNGYMRMNLGLMDAKDFVDNVGPHEMAHQWWGHQVGWRSYHDEWLSEGFAEFTASLVAQQTGGWNRYDAFYEKARKTILERPRGASIPNDEAGPISQGWRVSTWRNPAAYGALTYSKGAYVLHMIRMAMWDVKTKDDAFSTMMKEYASTYAGKNPTTADFQKIVEKHATRSLKLTTDGKLDYFFDQWVHGTAIPKFESKLEFKDAGGGKYRVTGTVTQSQVHENFLVAMPIYVHFDKTTIIRCGGVLLVGNQTQPVDFELALPKKPQKFSVNAMHDVLAR